MIIKSAIKRLFETTGFTIQRQKPVRGCDLDAGTYDRDGLRTIHSNAFMETPRFQAAYNRGVQAAGEDYNWQWRVHVGLWAAETATRVEGDFVECGVNRGFMSSAIMHYLDWNTRSRTFYLLDTFEGMDLAQANDMERDHNAARLNDGFYVKGVDAARTNFAEWKNTRVIQGAVPGTLAEVAAERIAFLSLDMNCAGPEVAALEHLWPRLSPGAIVLSDDYCYKGYSSQRLALDKVATALGVPILALPTGQGMIVK
jgi:hypothetical protein